jgi:PadR family transcriptional regulator, regulatory protein PadR
LTPIGEVEDNRVMKRKPGKLLSIEIAILASSVSLLRAGLEEFYGYAIAKELRDEEGAKRLTAHGTLYRALERLEKAGLLSSRWEDSEIAAGEERPRRRLYRLTAAGARAEADARVAGQTPAAAAAARERGLAPS